MTEHQLQLIVTQYLNLAMPPMIPWSACDHAAKLSARQGKARKDRGVKRGLADYRLVIPKGRSAEIELKVKGTYQSPDQKAWQKSVEAIGGLYAVCRSVEEVETVLAGWLTPWGHHLRARVA